MFRDTVINSTHYNLNFQNTYNFQSTINSPTGATAMDICNIFGKAYSIIASFEAIQFVDISSITTANTFYSQSIGPYATGVFQVNHFLTDTDIILELSYGKKMDIYKSSILTTNSL